MKKIEIKLTEQADERLEELIATASNDAIRTKLRNLHQVCRKIVCEAKTRLSVPLVVGHYKALFPDPAQRLAEQTIRNQRPGGNPYLSLYRKWVEVAENIVTAASLKTAMIDAGIIGEHDIRMIENPTLRHQITMLLGQNRSLLNQLNILKQSQTDIPIRIEGVGLVSGSTDLVLSDAEVEAVRDFIDERTLKAKHLQRTADDGLKLRDGRPIADPGFVTALEKISKSYEQPE